jgi:hypothetical protein
VGLWLLLVLLSPFGLLALDRLDDRDWQRLSAIGQTYGAVSALLAAVALCWVAVSTAQQLRSAQVDRDHMYRTVHIELARMLLDHPDLMKSLGSVLGTETLEDQRLNVYCNQLVLALQMGFEIGAVNEDYLVGSARELFASDVCWRWWAGVRVTRRDEATTAHQATLVEILDREWTLRAPGRPGTMTTANPSHTLRDPRMLEVPRRIATRFARSRAQRTLVILTAGGTLLVVARSLTARWDRAAQQGRSPRTRERWTPSA